MSVNKETLEKLSVDDLVQTVLNYDKALTDTKLYYTNMEEDYPLIKEKVENVTQGYKDLESQLAQADLNIKNLENDLAAAKANKKTPKDDSLKEENTQLKNEVKELKTNLKLAEDKLNHYDSNPKEVSHTEVQQQVIQTYNIIGYENNIGEKKYGGREYVKAISIIKFINESRELTINISSSELGIEKIESFILDDFQFSKLLEFAKETGYFKAFKKLLSIPDYVEQMFKETDFELIKEGTGE